MKQVFTLWVDCTTLGHFDTIEEAVSNTSRIEKYIKENPDALEEGEPRIYEYKYSHIEDGIMYADARLVKEYDLTGKLTYIFLSYNSL